MVGISALDKRFQNWEDSVRGMFEDITNAVSNTKEFLGDKSLINKNVNTLSYIFIIDKDVLAQIKKIDLNEDKTDLPSIIPLLGYYTRISDAVVARLNNRYKRDVLKDFGLKEGDPVIFLCALSITEFFPEFLKSLNGDEAPSIQKELLLDKNPIKALALLTLSHETGHLIYDNELLCRHEFINEGAAEWFSWKLLPEFRKTIELINKRKPEEYKKGFEIFRGCEKEDKKGFRILINDLLNGNFTLNWKNYGGQCTARLIGAVFSSRSRGVKHIYL